MVDACHEFSIDCATFTDIIDCESGGNPGAVNNRPDYTVTTRRASGLVQHLAHLYPPRAAAVGYPADTSTIFDPVANARSGAWLMATEGTGPWVWSQHCWG